MALERLPSSATADDVAAAIGRNGYAIVERVVAPALLDRAQAALQPHLDATPFGPDDFAGRRTRRTGGLIARSATCRELVVHPLVIGAVGKVLGLSEDITTRLSSTIWGSYASQMEECRFDETGFSIDNPDIARLNRFVGGLFVRLHVLVNCLCFANELVLLSNRCLLPHLRNHIFAQFFDLAGPGNGLRSAAAF